MSDLLVNYVIPIAASSYIIGGLSLGGYGLFKLLKSS